MLDQHHFIADLEAQVDGLRDSAERCPQRSTSRPRPVMGIGVGLFVIGFLLVQRASALVIGIAAVLGAVAPRWARIAGTLGGDHH